MTPQRPITNEFAYYLLTEFKAFLLQYLLDTSAKSNEELLEALEEVRTSIKLFEDYIEERRIKRNG